MPPLAGVGAALGGAASSLAPFAGAAGSLASMFGGRKQKAPSFQMPNVPGLGDLPHYLNLKQLAEQRIRAGTTGEETPGVGFGQNFVDRASSPGIANIDYNFEKRTLPTLSSELSKRGIARSAGQGLATDVINQADRRRNLDVNELISKFQVLNEEQKKRDITEGIGVAENQRATAAQLAALRTNAELQGQGLNQQAFQSMIDPNLRAQGAQTAGVGELLSSLFGGSTSTDRDRTFTAGIPKVAGSISAKTLANTPSGNLGGMNIVDLLKLLQAGGI